MTETADCLILNGTQSVATDTVCRVGAPILLRGSHCDVAELHGYSATMCVDTLQIVEAGCHGQVAVAYTDHHTCTWSTLYYQTQMWLEWK